MLIPPAPACKTSWTSLVQHLQARQAEFIQFIHRECKSYSVEKHYLDMFLADLEVTAIILGLQTCTAPPGNCVFALDFKLLLERIDIHCGSDEDLWLALTSGCFISHGNDGVEVKVFGIPRWWERGKPFPTYESVFKEWEELCAISFVESLSVCDTADKMAVFLHDTLAACVERSQEEERMCQDGLSRIIESTRKVTQIRGELGAILHGTGGSRL